MMNIKSQESNRMLHLLNLNELYFKNHLCRSMSALRSEEIRIILKDEAYYSVRLAVLQ